MNLSLGQRIALPVGDDTYQLGIVLGPDKVKLDTGVVKQVPDMDNLLRVGNTANQSKPLPADQLKMAPNWHHLLGSRDKCPVYGSQFLYGVWASVMEAAGLHLPTPMIRITDRMEPGHLGSYWHPKTKTGGAASPGGLIEIAKVRVFTYSGLVGTLIHEIAHQACWFKYQDVSHDGKWEHMVHTLSAAMGGVKIPMEVDGDDKQLYQLPEPTKAKHPIFFLVVMIRGQGYVTWADNKAEIEHIALKLPDPDLNVSIYETRDPTLLDWIPPEEELKKFTKISTEMLDRIKTGHRVY
jgi:hypothetical protein